MGVVIKVENLSKKFIIGHEKAEKYTALRDVVANKAKSIFSSSHNKGYTKEEFWALKDVNFEIEDGDRVGIIGRNGAGKSTLLKLLSRISEPTSGRISIKGRVASLLEVGTGFHPELTGRENVFLNGAILGMSRAEIRKKFDEIVAFAEVEKFLDTPVKRYSSGMYVRLAFAVAAHLEPEILVVDEVLAVGDAQFQKKCLGKMEDVSKNGGRTVLFVSHNMGIISQLCNKGILLNKGKVEISDKCNTVINRYILQSGQATDLGYRADETKIKNKRNYFNSIDLLNADNKATSDFSFNEPIHIHFTFSITEFNPNLQIGIGILDKYQNRVTTFLKEINFFTKKDDIYQGYVEVPAGIIAPNIYSFVFAIWAKGVEVWDIVENVCSFKIHDSGSELSIYEGADYGSIIINPVWKNG